MSYDIDLTIDTGGTEPAQLTEVRSPTYNLAPMFELALGQPIRSLDCLPASECIPFLRAAVQQMRRTPAKFRKLNPENGWGDYEGAVRALGWLLDGCLTHPKAIVHI